MRAGTLNRRLAVDEPIPIQDATGQPVIGWQEFGTVWGSIEPIRGREALVASTNLAIMDTRIRIRWSPDTDAIEPTWRLRYKSQIFDVVSAAHIKTGRQEIELLCKSGSNEG